MQESFDDFIRKIVIADELKSDDNLTEHARRILLRP